MPTLRHRVVRILAGGLSAAAAVLVMAGAALPLAPPVTAGPPECTDVGISTRVCTRGPGHTAITTSPNPAFTNPGAGWGFGTLGTPVFGLGGGGIWIGF